MDDFCCQQCTETGLSLRRSLALREAATILRARLLVRETEDYLKEVAG